MELVTVIIPLYTEHLTDNEWVSLHQTCRVLGNYPITVVKPQGLSLTRLPALYPNLRVESFDDGFFKNIRGYNRLMLSPDFYVRFNAFEYILIAQLDAYVFTDQLAAWCAKGYDYVGAPWLVKSFYRWVPWHRKFITDNRVGNGGFSLRKVASHWQAVTQLASVLPPYLEAAHHWYHEDVFFAVEPNRHGLGFRYPDPAEALQFSFDKYPHLCYKRNHRQLPFGCHGWDKRKMKRFWKKHI